MQSSSEDVPLTPVVVDCVTFDRAPLGRRGYHEDQVDDLLDRVQATLAGADSLTAQEVRDVTFDSAPLIRRGYHEDQVDEFLDLVVEELERRARRRGRGTAPAGPATEPRPAQPKLQPLARLTPVHPAPPTGRPTPQPPVNPAPTQPAPTQPPSAQPPPTQPVHAQPVPPPTPVEQTSPMLFTLPPSMPAATRQPSRPEPPPSVTEPQIGPAGSAAAAGPPVAPTEPPAPLATPPAAPPEPAEPAEPAQPTPGHPDTWRDSDLLALGLPPAPPGERGYRPGDVARLINLLADAIHNPDSDSPTPDDIAGLKLSRTFFIGQGYHTGAVDTLRAIWVDELRRRAL